MTFVQLCINLWLNTEFARLRTEEPEFVVMLTAMLLLSNVVWVYYAYRQTVARVIADIDYIGDLVWNNNNEGHRPEDDRIASNRDVRFALFLTNLFELPYIVKEVVNLCHPRKGIMTYGAFGGWGRLPRTIALGYANKFMFGYEETAGTLTTVPHIVMGKLPTVLLKVFIFVRYKSTWILGMSIAWSSMLLVVKIAAIIEYTFKAHKLKKWCVDNYEEGPPEQRTVIERKLLRDFYFQFDHHKKLVDPGTRGWLMQMAPVSVERSGHRDGFLHKWTAPDRMASKRICCSSGGERIPDAVIDRLRLADEQTGCVRTEFWYCPNDDGALEYSDPTRGRGRDPLQAGHGDGWRYARLVTVSSFTKELMMSLVKASLNSMYAVGMLNLCFYLLSQDDLEFAISIWVFGLFALTRIAWFLFALWQSQQTIVVDWKEVGDFVTDVGLVGRIMLFVSNLIIHMFVLPKQVREAVTLFHPEKSFQPYCAFGGRNFGPRVFAIGFATKDMYHTESYHGALPQVPLLLADSITMLALAWTLALEFGVRGDLPTRANKIDYCERFNIIALITTSLALSFTRACMLHKYIRARYRYREWLEARMVSNNVHEAELNALRKHWFTHFAYF